MVDFNPEYLVGPGSILLTDLQYISIFFNSFLIYLLVIFVAFLVLKRCKNRVIDYILALFIGLGSAEFIKYVVDKPRPLSIISSLAFEGGSFPSTHATLAFTAAFFYLLVCCHTLTEKKGRGGKQKDSRGVIEGNIMALVIFFLAAVVGALRVLIGAHYCVDVFAGAILGLTVSLPFRYYDVVARKAR